MDIIYTSVVNIKKDDYLVVSDRPCKVTEVTFSKTGKTGRSKAHFVAFDIFTDKRYEGIKSTNHIIQIPTVERSTYYLSDITDDSYLVLMDEHGKIREDLTLTDEKLKEKLGKVYDKIDEYDIIMVVLTSMGISQVVDILVKKIKN